VCVLFIFILKERRVKRHGEERERDKGEEKVVTEGRGEESQVISIARNIEYVSLGHLNSHRFFGQAHYLSCHQN
jgi:hypothetical protein